MDISHYSITECKALTFQPLFLPRKALHEADIDVAALINEADTWMGLLYVMGMNSVTHVMLECFTKKPQTTGWLCTS